MVRLNYIDRLKGICMLLIIWGHTVSSFDIVSQWATGFKVTAFYAVTGFLLGLRQDENGITKPVGIKKLLLSAGVPYAFYSLLSLFLSVLLMLIQKRPPEFLTQKLLSTFTLSGVSTLWFLPSMFFGRLMFEQLYFKKFFSYLKPIVFAVLPFLLWFFALKIQAFTSETLTLEQMALSMVFSVIFKFLIAFWFIGIGFELSMVKKLLQGKKTLSVIVTAVSFCLGTAAAFFNKGVDLNGSDIGNMPMLFFASGVLISFSLMCALEPLRKIKMPFTEYVGKNSLFFMVTHMPLYILPVVTLVVGKFIEEGFAASAVSFVLVFIILSVMLNIKNAVIKLLNKAGKASFLNYI